MNEIAWFVFIVIALIIIHRIFRIPEPPKDLPLNCKQSRFEEEVGNAGEITIRCQKCLTWEGQPCRLTA